MYKHILLIITSVATIRSIIDCIMGYKPYYIISLHVRGGGGSIVSRLGVRLAGGREFVGTLANIHTQLVVMMTEHKNILF